MASQGNHTELQERQEKHMKKGFSSRGSRLAVLACLMLVLTSWVSLDAQKVKVGVSFYTLTNPFFLEIRDAAKAVVEKAGGQLVVVSSEFDVNKQVSQVEDLIASGVKAIILNPADSKAVTPAVEAANKAKIPVITVDINAEGGDVDSFVASDNVMAGRLAGQYAAQRLKGKGNVVILDWPLVNAVVERVDGFKAAVKPFPGIKIIDVQNAGANRDGGLKIMENMLQAHPDIDCVFSINDPSGMGGLAAIQAANAQNKMFIVSVDAQTFALEEIKKEGGKTFAMTAAQFPTLMGQYAAEMAMRRIRGERVPSVVKTPTATVTLDNVDEFLKKTK
jgi:ribose transport system substrate-binding protein